MYVMPTISKGLINDEYLPVPNQKETLAKQIQLISPIWYFSYKGINQNLSKLVKQAKP